MMLTAITFMYLSAKAVTDKEYRAAVPRPAARRGAPDTGGARPVPLVTAEAMNDRCPTSDDVHEWFLGRGLPLVLTRRVRSRALIERSAPVVSGIGAVIALTALIADFSDGSAEVGTVVRLAIMAAVLIAAPFVLYLLHRAGTTRSEAGRRSAALVVMALFVIGFPLADSGWTGLTAAEVAGFGVVALLAVWLTYLGIGSIVLVGLPVRAGCSSARSAR